MRGANVKAFNRQAAKVAGQTIRTLAEPISQASRDAAASIRNEQITRLRVDRLEVRADEADAFRARTFRERLRWLLTGK